MIGHVVSKKETPEEWAKFARLWGEYYERGGYTDATRNTTAARRRTQRS